MTAEVAQSAEVQPSVPERKKFDILKVIGTCNLNLQVVFA